MQEVDSAQCLWGVHFLIKHRNNRKNNRKMEIREVTMEELKRLTRENNLLEFNRPITAVHVQDMIASVQRCGLLRLPVIGNITKFDGRDSAIIDGQHLCSALVKMRGPGASNKTIKVIWKTYHEKRDVINDIAILNNTSKSWGDNDYLHAWVKFGADNDNYSFYSHLQLKLKQYEKLSNMTLNLLMECYAVNDRKKRIAFKEGMLTFKDIDYSDQLVKYVAELLEAGMHGGVSIGFARWAHTMYFTKGIEIDWKKIVIRIKHTMKTETDPFPTRELLQGRCNELYSLVKV